MTFPIEYKAIAILIFLAILGGIGFGIHEYEVSVYNDGYRTANTERDAADAKALTAATADALAKERTFKTALDAAEAKRLAEKADYEKDKNDAVRAARAGNSGMRCPGIALRTDAPPPSASVTGESGPSQDDRLVPQAAGDILDIAGTGAQDVRDYNALLLEYHRLRAFANDQGNESKNTR